MKLFTLLLLAMALSLSGCRTVQVTPSPPKLTDLPLDEALAMDLSQSELQRVFSNQFTTRNAEGRLHAALDIMPVCVDNLSPDASYATLGKFMTQLLRAGQYDDLQRTIDYVRNMFPTRIGLQELCTIAEIDCLLTTSRFDKAAALLMTESRELSDANMAAVTGRLLARGRSKTDIDTMEQVCEFVTAKTRGKRRVVDAVARKWVSLAQQQGKLELVPDRLARLLQLGATPALVARSYSGAGNDVLRLADKDMLQLMMQIGQSLLSRVGDKNTVLDIARTMLDFSCIIENFDASVNLLRICYQDELDGEEYLSMSNKVLAHKALQEGRTEEAVRRFRDFMEGAKEWKTDQYDPFTGETAPTSAVLGLNAMRIGDILAAADDKDGAAAAYAEAKTYYQAAVEKVKDGTAWKANIEKALKELSSR